MRKIIFATSNQDKMREIREILSDFPVEIISMKEAGVHTVIMEDGVSFEENAIIKAETVMKITGSIVLADDSGLEIDCLDGEPGIYSARYMGEDTPYHEKNMNLIHRMERVEGNARSARFVCAVAAAFPDQATVTVRGILEGQIGFREEGENGFGYDPIFWLPEYGCTTAALPPEQKNAISHRGRALRLIRPVIRNYLIEHGD